jgi:hypothetical protein
LNVVVALELGLPQPVDDVLVDDCPHSRHQEGEVDLHGKTVSVQQLVVDGQSRNEVGFASQILIVAAAVEDVGEEGVDDHNCDEN